MHRRWYLATLIVVSVCGASDEFHQAFVPGRYVEFFDWLADTIGGCVGASICLIPWIREFPRDDTSS
jgi:VanZ family protein